jgi:hypothetical protein
MEIPIMTLKPTTRNILRACAAILALTATSGLAADRYLGASVDKAGKLRIVGSDKKTIVIPKEPEQVGFDEIAISKDGQAIGWLETYPKLLRLLPPSFGAGDLLGRQAQRIHG